MLFKETTQAKYAGLYKRDEGWVEPSTKAAFQEGRTFREPTQKRNRPKKKNKRKKKEEAVIKEEVNEEINDNSVIDCEAFGLDCSCYNPFGGDPDHAGKCELADRADALNIECCGQLGQDCSSGTPNSCNRGCAAVVLPFWEDCEQALGPAASLFNQLLVDCRATIETAAGPSAEPSAEPATGGSSCLSNPCQNGGTCADATTDLSLTGDEYSCTCATSPMTGEPLHWGVNCETSEDDCTLDNDPCLSQPGTTCVDCARFLPASGGSGQGPPNPDCPQGYTCVGL